MTGHISNHQAIAILHIITQLCMRKNLQFIGIIKSEETSVVANLLLKIPNYLSSHD